MTSNRSCTKDVAGNSKRESKLVSRRQADLNPEPVTSEQLVRLYVEVELGIPPEDSMVPPSAERDKMRAEAARWVKNARYKGIAYELPFD